MKIRYLKVLRDLTTDLTKNSMLVLAIAIGVFGIGCILGGYTVIKREMTINYKGTLPASATLELERAISRQLIDSLRTLPGIQAADRRATLIARMQVDGKWYPLLLFVVDDFTNMPINRFGYLSGATVPALGTMLVERTALRVMDASEGTTITVKTKAGTPKSVRLSGTVHDPSLAPAWQEQAGYGYITLETLRWLGESQDFDQLKIRVSANETSVPHITQQANQLATWLEKNGYPVHEIQVPPPNRHPHQSQMDAVMSIFIVFSFLILLLASVLVSTSMATLMVKQVRQIGVMKTIGATSGQITALYLFMMVLICTMALGIGIPLSRIAATVLYSKIAVLLNLELLDSSIPYWVVLVQVGAGLLIPLLTVAFPVVRGSRQSIRHALDNYGIPFHKPLRPVWASWLTVLSFGNDTLRLSLRNVFRQRSRLLMTLGLLAAGGAMFMTALNVSEAWDNNLRRIYTQRLYDLEVRFSQPIQAEAIIQKLRAVNGIRLVEGGSSAAVSLKQEGPYAVTRTYPDKGHGSFSIQAIPAHTTLLNPTLTEGRWLQNSTAPEVVLNQLAPSAGMRLGDTITLAIDDKTTTWTIVGFTEDVGSPATAYVSSEAYATYMHTGGQATMLRIAFTDRSKPFVASKTRELERILEQSGVSVRSTVPVWLLHNAIAAHMRILVNSLLAMAILMALVGTLGLLSTMSMNVMERTRELGVMRAIGATPKTIRQLIIGEGIAIGIISIAVAMLLALPLSTYLGRFIGHMAFRTPLGLTVSPIALGIWIAIILIGSYLATAFPARRANRLTTREALAYE